MTQRGVHTLQDLKLRCRVCDITGCWIWAHATEKGKPRLSVSVEEGRYIMSGRRAVLTLKARARPPSDVWAVALCSNRLCVAPHHTRAGTQQEAAQAASEMFDAYQTVASKSARYRAGKTRRRLTDEQVQEIRSGKESLAQLAARFGMATRSLARIRNGETYKTVGASVFTWRPVCSLRHLQSAGSVSPPDHLLNADEPHVRQRLTRSHESLKPVVVGWKAPNRQIQANDEGSIAA